MIAQIDNLIRALSRLPGLGRRSAERAALALLRNPATVADPLVLALREARAALCCCSLCGGFTSLEHDPCCLCTATSREMDILCVVEEPADIFVIERAGVFTGRYHALMGKLSPARQTGPTELRLQSLGERVARESIREVVLALSTDMEGDATAGYIVEMLKTTQTQVTRLAFGLPADSGVSYSDPLTLKRAINGRISCS